MRTERGRGTTTTLIVPIAAAVQRVLLVGIGDERVALPIVKVERILQLAADEVERNAGDSFALVDDEPTPVVDLAPVLGIPSERPEGEAMLVLCELRGERVALEVDRFAGQQEIYVKPVPELLAPVKVLAGLTILGDGSPVFLLDLNHLV